MIEIDIEPVPDQNGDSVTDFTEGLQRLNGRKIIPIHARNCFGTRSTFRNRYEVLLVTWVSLTQGAGSPPRLSTRLPLHARKRDCANRFPERNIYPFEPLSQEAVADLANFAGRLSVAAGSCWSRAACGTHSSLRTRSGTVSSFSWKWSMSASVHFAI